MKRFTLVTIVNVMMLVSMPAFAACYVNCDKTQTAAQPIRLIQNNQHSQVTRSASHDTGNVRNGIIGDVTIRNGHEHLEIGPINAQTSIDASISNTIILGDMVQ